MAIKSLRCGIREDYRIGTYMKLQKFRTVHTANVVIVIIISYKINCNQAVIAANNILR